MGQYKLWNPSFCARSLALHVARREILAAVFYKLLRVF